MKFEWGTLLVLGMIGNSDEFRAPLEMHFENLATPFKSPGDIHRDTLACMAKNFHTLEKISRLDTQNKLSLGQYFKDQQDHEKARSLALEVLESPHLSVEQYLNAIDLFLCSGGDHDTAHTFLIVISEYPGLSILEETYICEKFAQIERFDKQREMIEKILTYPHDDKDLPVWEKIYLLEKLALTSKNHLFVEETAEKIMQSPKFRKIYTIKIAKLLLGINRAKSIEILHEIADDPQMPDKMKFYSKTLLSLFDAKNNTVIIHGFLP